MRACLIVVLALLSGCSPDEPDEPDVVEVREPTPSGASTLEQRLDAVDAARTVEVPCEELARLEALWDLFLDFNKLSEGKVHAFRISTAVSRVSDFYSFGRRGAASRQSPFDMLERKRHRPAAKQLRRCLVLSASQHRSANVLKGPASAPTWNRAASLANTDAIAVCSLPVDPGFYSACRDETGIRRVVYVAKSQVFTSSPPPTSTSSGARVLDLSRVPVEITESGLYVLDRNWGVGGFPSGPSGGAIVITADSVILDLQGFELRSSELAITSTGSGVTIRNGRVDAGLGGAIRVSGVGSRIERVDADLGRGGAISLNGAGSILTDSTFSVRQEGFGVTAGDDTIVRNNSISSRYIALRASSGTTLVDNQVSCYRVEPCIVVDGSANTISRNTVKDLFEAVDALVIRGDFNHAMDNVFIACGGSRLRAMVVEGTGNVLRDNLVPSCAGSTGWGAGIVFLRDGNFYGDNIVWAGSPFNVGATVQTDLGGNVGFGN